MTQREMRRYQAQRRGSKRSYLSELEDACVVIAWIYGDLSEGQAARWLKKDRVTVREMRDALRARGVELLNRQQQGAGQ